MVPTCYAKLRRGRPKYKGVIQRSRGTSDDLVLKSIQRLEGLKNVELKVAELSTQYASKRSESTFEILSKGRQLAKGRHEREGYILAEINRLRNLAGEPELANFNALPAYRTKVSISSVRVSAANR